VQYTTAAAPITTRLCWCRLCQFIAAGNAAVSVCFPSAGLSVSEDSARAFGKVLLPARVTNSDASASKCPLNVVAAGMV